MENDEKKKEDQLYNDAKKRVTDLKDFYTHFLIYIFVNAFLFIINLVTSPNTLWFYWPLLGWGIGVIAHAISVFGVFGFMDKSWEEKKIKEYIDKNKK
jgi:hypothetical protein